MLTAVEEAAEAAIIAAARSGDAPEGLIVAAPIPQGQSRAVQSALERMKISKIAKVPVLQTAVHHSSAAPASSALRELSLVAGAGAGVGRVQRPVVMAVAPLDSSALFHDLAFGADSAVSAFVAVLAAADALSRTDAFTLPNQVRCCC